MPAATFSYTASVSSSGSFSVTGTDLWGQPSNEVDGTVSLVSNGVSAGITPQITLSAQVLPGQEVLLTGTVMDDLPGGATVTFSGAASGTAVTDANGNFSFTTTAAELGTVYAVAVDQNQQTTNTASAQIAVAAPLLTMYVSSVADGLATFSGKLTDIDAEGETIHYSGAASGTVATDANGDFSITLPATGTGTLTAVTTDLWGRLSDADTDNVPANELAILDFGEMQIFSGWKFEGRVVGSSDVTAVTVTLDGQACLSGSTVNPNEDGDFMLLLPRSATLDGEVSAVAMDPATGLESATVSTFVTPAFRASLPNILERGNPANLAGDMVSLTFDGDNPHNEALTFSATDLPDGLTIDPNSGVVTGTVADDAVSSTSYAVSITATDAYGDQATEEFSWSVAPARVNAQAVNAISALAGFDTGTVTLATFTTTDQNSQAANFAATVYWGDGSSDQAIVSGASGSFTVTDDHTFTATGSSARVGGDQQQPRSDRHGDHQRHRLGRIACDPGQPGRRDQFRGGYGEPGHVGRRFGRELRHIFGV